MEKLNIPGNETASLRLLQMSAYAVIVAWGIQYASGFLSIVLISLLWAFSVLPFTTSLRRRYRVRKGTAVLCTVILLIAIDLILHFALLEAYFHMGVKLVFYEQQLQALYERIIQFLVARGVEPAALSSKSLYSAEHMITFVEVTLPKALGLFSDRILVSILSVVFLIEIAEIEDRAKTPLARALLYYGQDVQRFIAISAKTGAITALANLTLLIALGVDFPVLWCVLYFFLQFIPTIGFVIAVIPPAILALLAFGWKRALFVVIGLTATQMISDYLLQPILMKKGLHISFLLIMLSLLLWGFLLGPVGSIVGVPLTLALRKYIQEPLDMRWRPPAVNI